MDTARQLGIHVTTRYLFRKTSPDLGVKDALDTSAAEARLKSNSREMHADEGKTFHGFRSACDITLALSGAELTEIMDHVGWSKRHTALHYMQSAKVLNPAGASARLASHQAMET